MIKSSTLTTSLASLQWLFFIFVNTIVVPLSIGMAFELTAYDVAGIVRSSLVFTGLACLLQGLIGHRFPLMEGQSGVMWGVMLNLCFSASSMGMSYTSIGGGIASGMLLAGIVVVVLGVFDLLGFLAKIFNPMVMSVYLFLLTFHLIFIFFEGMLKISLDGSLDIPITLFSLGIAAFVGLLIIKGGRVLSNFAILSGMIIGWVLYVLVFPADHTANGPLAHNIPIFPLGKPNLNIGIIMITFIASIVNLSNTIASIQAVSVLLKKKIVQAHLNRSYILTGLFSIVSAVTGLVSYAPYASSIGFLESTRIFSRKPFLIGGGLMALLGIVPFLGGLLATLPLTVGYAVLFVAYLQLLGTSLKSLNGYIFNSKTIYRFATPVLIGISIMYVDSSIFMDLPIWLQPLVSNGFVMGVLLSIVLERIVTWDDTQV